MIQLSFAQEWHYDDNDDGISIEVGLVYVGTSIEVQAKVDPGAAVCLFSNEDGRDLGIPIEQGIPKRLGGLTGSLEAYGHEVTLQMGDIAFQSLVYFAKYPGLPRNLLGRQGWLRNLRLGLIDYENLLYLSAYDS
ncbi:MAG TPA: retropepsin-like aspartic protease [Blastocatellia bacterium]|nr:retropepsin-like aspartic protease [Blastocatellia bacterium]HMV86734.1 retropepsin-like aspartic protease [Blastocatellia bacterium]HMX26486.1 retropepsin-like aspartic protease [Blastocatellia bacterium]HMY76125.1 retropepsin-like aspartic protease [Blastocatellia bacterium]HMZ20004.1 retropepsin-like aspartic protease [Blastocatellia bacterium]